MLKGGRGYERMTWDKNSKLEKKGLCMQEGEKMKQQHSVANKYKEIERWLLTGGLEQMKQKDNGMVHEGTGKRESEGNSVY